MSDPNYSTSRSGLGFAAGAAAAALLTWGVAVGYYGAYFPLSRSAALATALVTVVGLHVVVGYRSFTAGRALPWGRVLAAAVVGAAVRFAFVYTFLRHHVPPSRVFHHPERAIWYIALSSVALVLLGYGVAQYRHARRAQRGPSESMPTYASTRPDAAAPEDASEFAVLTFRSEGRDVRLPVPELLYVRANGEYMLYCCADRRYPRFQRLKEAEAELAPWGFVRIHRSYLVARAAVRAWGKAEAVLADGTELPVSRTYRRALGQA